MATLRTPSKWFGRQGGEHSAANGPPTQAEVTQLAGADHPRAGTSAPMVFQQGEPRMAMSTAQYLRIQQKIRTNIESAGTSVWLTTAFTFAGIGATLLTTIVATTLDPSTRGKLEVGAWCCLVFVVLATFAHLKRQSEKKRVAEDIIDEMDTYIFHRVASEDASP